MSFGTYNILAQAIGVAVLIALAVALYALVFMIVRWKTPQRRGYVFLLIGSLIAVPCLIGINYAIIWGIYIPALGREQMAKLNAHRAEQLAATSLVHVGEPAPNFEVTDADGATFSLAAAKGKVVVINFFATWCGPCLLELPHVETLWQEHRSQPNVALLVIGREETLETVRAFREKNKFTFPIAADPDRGVYARFATESIPRTIVVGPDGIIAYSQAGFMEQEVDALKAVVSEQLARTK